MKARFLFERISGIAQAGNEVCNVYALSVVTFELDFREP
jgi:hypothetical protein